MTTLRIQVSEPIGFGGFGFGGCEVFLFVWDFRTFLGFFLGCLVFVVCFLDVFFYMTFS